MQSEDFLLKEKVKYKENKITYKAPITILKIWTHLFNFKPSSFIIYVKLSNNESAVSFL